jgi:murein DD-endopeptidase MepM/ murein hydrolase activator NlpD
MKNTLLLFILTISVHLNAATCNKVVTAAEDPTAAQITGTTFPTISGQLKWVQPASSTYKVAFTGTAGSAASHEGIDFVHNDQTIEVVEVYAAADGKVMYVREGCEQSSMFAHNNTARESGAGWGNHIVIEHKGLVFTRYAHLLKNSILVNVGDSVKAGQKIATMGNSGRSETRHLHFELGTKASAFNSCAMSQNFDFVFNGNLVLGSAPVNNAIVLVSPPNNASLVSNNSCLKWELASGVTQYTVEIATNQNFTNIIRTQTTASSEYCLEQLPIQKLYWRVISNTGLTSEVFTFEPSTTESFEFCPVNGLPGGWLRFAFDVTKGTITNNDAWLATSVDRKRTGNFSCKMPNYMTDSECWLVSPAFHITPQTINPTFWRSTTAGDYGSILKLYYIESANEPAVKANYQFIRSISEGADANWNSETVNVAPMLNKTIRLAFMVKNFGNPTDVNAGGDNWWIDDIILPLNPTISRAENLIANMKVKIVNNAGKYVIYNNSENELKSFQVFDMTGKMLVKSNFDNNENSFTLSQNGIYILNLQGQNVNLTQKIVNRN